MEKNATKIWFDRFGAVTLWGMFVYYPHSEKAGEMQPTSPRVSCFEFGDSNKLLAIHTIVYTASIVLYIPKDEFFNHTS